MEYEKKYFADIVLNKEKLSTREPVYVAHCVNLGVTRMTTKKSFTERCYALLKKVPRGKVTTYKALAEALGTRAYRAVGQAMHTNPYGAWGRAGGGPSAKQSEMVPCHRVVKSDGSIGGFAHGARRKAVMLRNEGVEVRKGKIDLQQYAYPFL